MNKERLRYFIEKLGLIFMFAITINFYIVLVVAMFNNHAVTVYFNHFSEALIEYVMYIAILPVIIYSTYIQYKEMYRLKKLRKAQRMKNEQL